jgi:hypothetical protein
MKGKRTLIYPDFVFKPEDWLRFVQFDHFVAHWKTLGLGDDDLRALEVAIMAAPAAAPVVAGTGGLRKLRFAPPRWNTGIPEYAVVTLATVYAKNRKDNLTPAEKAGTRKVIREIEEFLAKEKSGGTKRRK